MFALTVSRQRDAGSSRPVADVIVASQEFGMSKANISFAGYTFDDDKGCFTCEHLHNGALAV